MVERAFVDRVTYIALHKRYATITETFLSWEDYLKWRDSGPACPDRKQDYAVFLLSKVEDKDVSGAHSR